MLSFRSLSVSAYKDFRTIQNAPTGLAAAHAPYLSWHLLLHLGYSGLNLSLWLAPSSSSSRRPLCFEITPIDADIFKVEGLPCYLDCLWPNTSSPFSVHETQYLFYHRNLQRRTSEYRFVVKSGARGQSRYASREEQCRCICDHCAIGADAHRRSR